MVASSAAEVLQPDIEQEQGATGSQYLSFTLGNELYAVDILKVQEIREWETVTCLPNTPAHIKGVINLRGSIVPVLDLRERFALEQVEYLPTTVVIVVAVEGDKGERHIGIVVDSVADVIQLAMDSVKAPPHMNGQVSTEFIAGLGTSNGRMVVMLDMARLCDPAELGDIE